LENLTQGVQIGMGWVMHQRQKKEVLHFQYPIFNVLIPIHKYNLTEIKFSNHWFLKLKSKDFLDGSKTPLFDKITEFLNNKLSYEADEIILQTMPRMFGYVFNPVSFWFCYQNKKLDAVLCEVNNTFGDRHFYFVHLDENSNSARLKKNFHVSPFFKIEGHYEFKFDILEKTNSVQIDYFNEAQEKTLITKVYLKKEDLLSVSSTNLLLKYGWMTPLVVIRIHYLALKLWIRKIPFYSRPQPQAQEITHEKIKP
jgi:uncharacterized protein